MCLYYNFNGFFLASKSLQYLSDLSSSDCALFFLKQKFMITKPVIYSELDIGRYLGPEQL